MNKTFPGICESTRVLERVAQLNITPEALDDGEMRNFADRCSAVAEAQHVESLTEFEPLKIEGRTSLMGTRATVRGANVLVTDLLDEAPRFAPAHAQLQQRIAQISHHPDRANIVAAIMGC